MSSTTITRGNALETFYIAPSITPASVASYTTAVQTFNIPGLLTTDIILAIGAQGTAGAGRRCLRHAWVCGPSRARRAGAGRTVVAGALCRADRPAR